MTDTSYSSNGQRSERPTIDDPAIVRKRVLGIIEHNADGPQPLAAHVSSIVGIAARVDYDLATVRSVLNTLAEEGVIERVPSRDIRILCLRR